MKKDVSIILPSIRPHFLETFYASVQSACQNHTFEIVIPTPFDVPDVIKQMDNVKIVRTYGTPTVAKQMAILLCNGEFLYNTTDDGIELEGAIDDAIEMHRSTLTSKDIINMIYVEGQGVLNPDNLQPNVSEVKPWPAEMWDAWYWPDLQKPGIKKGWRISLHFFMKLDYFYELGGFDCRWEYSNHAIHDMVFRVQQDGGKVIDLPKIASLTAHYPGHTYDHGPVHDAILGRDAILFNQIYANPDAAKERRNLNYSNWKNEPEVWKRRFFRHPEYELPTTFEQYKKYSVRTEPPADMAPNPGTPEYDQWFKKLQESLGDLTKS